MNLFNFKTYNKVKLNILIFRADKNTKQKDFTFLMEMREWFLGVTLIN